MCVFCWSGNDGTNYIGFLFLIRCMSSALASSLPIVFIFLFFFSFFLSLFLLLLFREKFHVDVKPVLSFLMLTLPIWAQILWPKQKKERRKEKKVKNRKRSSRLNKVSFYLRMFEQNDVYIRECKQIYWWSQKSPGAKSYSLVFLSPTRRRRNDWQKETRTHSWFCLYCQLAGVTSFPVSFVDICMRACGWRRRRKKKSNSTSLCVFFHIVILHVERNTSESSTLFFLLLMEVDNT